MRNLRWRKKAPKVIRMGNPYLSVIIPSYNRSRTLALCLDRLFNQSLSRESYEVIVVDDGSEDDTLQILKDMQKSYSGLKFYTQRNAGQGNARNLALKHASGQIIVFIGDDIYAEKDFLKKHARFHTDHPESNISCLGRIEWFPGQKISEFMNWLTHGGPQFAFDNLKSEEEAGFWYFYTSNISLKKELLKEENFDPDFKSYGWEDIELAYRLVKKYNLKIIYRKEILAHHDHQIEEKSLEKRMFSIGKSADLFQRKHKELRVVPRGVKLFALKIIGGRSITFSLYLVSKILPFTKKYYWYALSKRYFILGLENV